MTKLDVITKIEFWKQRFGLYPMLINPQRSMGKFLMLNGGNKDFCLQTSHSENSNRDEFFSDSWSTNAKNFIVVNKDYVHVYNWLKEKSDKYKKKDVAENPGRFYEYLSAQSYKTQDDVVPFIIGIFRKLRDFVGEKDPEKALNLLFGLLIGIEEDCASIDFSELGDISVPPHLDNYVDRIRRGVNSIVPKRDLILRHVSGALFQEAHKEIVFLDRQVNLFGEFSHKLITKDVAYSGVHYTPSYLARAIVENCLKQIDLRGKNKIKIFDPACGSSEFLIETLKQLQNMDYTGNVEIVGWDTSKTAISISKFLLTYEKQTQWQNDNRLNIDGVRQVEDSLTEHWDSDYDLIIMNPPFVSWELLDDAGRNSMLGIVGSTTGKPNQAAAFFFQAAKSLQENGVLGCILPTTVFTSDSYFRLRDKIREEFTLTLLATLGNYIFGSALTDISFFIGKKSSSSILPKLLWGKNEKGVVQDVLLDLRRMEYANRIAVDEKNYSIYTPRRFPIVSNSWKIISLKEELFLVDVENLVADKRLAIVADVFDVKQGIRTGYNQAFVLSHAEYNKIPKSEKKFYQKVLNNNSIKNGVITLENYIWYPYDSNGIIMKDEAVFRKTAPFSYKRMLLFKESLLNRARQGINTWWHLSEYRAWMLKNETLLYSTEFGKSDSFAIDEIGDFVVERGCAWVPNEPFETDDYYFYLSVLSSEIFDLFLSIYAKRIQSGFYLGKASTKDIPIPNVHLQEIRASREYCRLVELGKGLANGDPYVKHIINDIVKICYNQDI